MRRIVLALSLVAGILGVAPQVAHAAPTVVSYSPETAPNTGTYSVTMTGVGLNQVTRVVLFLPAAEHPTLAAEDKNANSTLDCIETPAVQTVSSARCRIGTLGASTPSSLVVTFPVAGVAPSTKWQIRTWDASGPTTSCPTQSGPGCISITAAAPTVTTVTSPTAGTPPVRGQGAAAVAVTVTGSNFFPGATLAATVPAEAANLTIANVVLTRGSGGAPDQITANIAVAEDAAVATNVLSVVNTDAKTATVAFSVVAGPVITALGTTARGRGTTGNLAITGTGFATGASATTLTSPTTGVTLSSVVISSATNATATLNVAADAATGTASVVATNPANGGRGTATFEIVADFAISRIAPSTFRVGASNRTVTITGSNFRTVPESNITFSPSGIIAFDDAGANLTITATQIQFRVDVQPAAAVGNTVTVVVAPPAVEGGPTVQATLTIVGIPNVTSYTPATIGRGAVAAPLAIAGTHLDPTSTYTFSGTGVTVGTCTGNTTLISCPTTVAVDATIAGRDLTIAQTGEANVVITAPKLQVGVAPTITAATPTSIGQGALAVTVTLTGTGLAPGAGTGMDLGAGVTATGCSGTTTSVTCTVSVDPAAATGNRNPSIINGDYGRATCTCAIAINAGPTITSVAPDELSVGVTTTLTITGTGFVTGVTFDLGAGVTLSGITGDATTRTGTVAVSASAATGVRSVSAVNGDKGRGVCAANPCLTIIPPMTLTGVEPAFRGVGASDAELRFLATNIPAETTVSMGAGITVSASGLSGTDFKATIDVASDAAPGARDIVFTAPDGSIARCAGCFEVQGIPVIGSFERTTVGAGAIGFAVPVTGSGFQPGASVAFSGTATGSITYGSATAITLLVDVPADATLGEINVTITNPNGGTPGGCVAASAECLSIVAAPTIESITPATLPQGILGAEIDVIGTGIVAGATLDLGTGIEVEPSTDATATTFSVSATVAEAAATGARAATLVNGDGGRATLPDGLTISAGPKITGVNPFSLEVGTQTVAVTGTGLGAGLAAAIGNGVTVKAVSSITATGFSLQVTVAAGAPLGVRDLVVTMPDGGRGTGVEALGVGDPDDDAVTVSAVGGLANGGAALTFYRSVTGLTTENLIIAERDSGDLLDATLECADVAGVEIACDASRVRRAELRSRTMLVPGEYYRVTLNPVGVTPAQMGGSPVAQTADVIRAVRDVDDRTSAFEYRWEDTIDRRASGGRYLREATEGAAVVISFSGDSVTWVTPRGPAFGKATVFVDGVRRAVIDNSWPTMRFGVRRVFAGFGEGSHQLTIVVRGEPGQRGNGAFVAVDAISDADGWRANPRVDDRWAKLTDRRASGRTVTASGWRGTRANATFRGTGAILEFIGGPDAGRAQILVDGRAQRTIDLYAAAPRRIVVGVAGLSDDRHVVRIVVLGAKRAASRDTLVRFDRLRVS